MQHMRGGLDTGERGNVDLLLNKRKYFLVPLLLGDGVFDLNTFPMKFHFT